MKKKTEKKDKKNHHWEKVFQKSESDFYKEQEQWTYQENHKRVYGVRSFDETSSEENQMKDSLKIIKEVDESMPSDQE